MTLTSVVTLMSVVSDECCDLDKGGDPDKCCECDEWCDGDKF